MAGSNWVKWHYNTQLSPLVWKLKDRLKVDHRLAACYFMEFFGWFDGSARSFKLSMNPELIEQLSKNLSWPLDLVEALVDVGALTRCGDIYTAPASNRDWSGPGQRRRKDRHVYFMLSPGTGMIKIGISHDPKGRARDLSTTEKITVLGSFPGSEVDERRLHHKFKDQRRHGEWFSPSPDLIAFIEGKGFAVNAAG